MTQLDLKNEEIQGLTDRVSSLEAEKAEWGLLMSKRSNEIQELKLDNFSLIQSLEQAVGVQSELRQTIASLEPAEPPKDVLFLHDSLGKPVNATLCQREGLSTEKALTYTLAEAKTCITRMKKAPRLIVLHVGTNDLPTKNRRDEIDGVLDKVDDLVATIKTKFPKTKILLSLLLPRLDCGWKKRFVQYVNSCLQIDFLDDPRVTLCEHPDVDEELLAVDKLHLKPEGTAKLAMNLRRAIALALDVPLKEKPR